MISALLFLRRNAKVLKLDEAMMCCGFPKMSFKLIERRENTPAVAIVNPVPTAVDAFMFQTFGRQSSLKAESDCRFKGCEFLQTDIS